MYKFWTKCNEERPYTWLSMDKKKNITGMKEAINVRFGPMTQMIVIHFQSNLKIQIYIQRN